MIEIAIAMASVYLVRRNGFYGFCAGDCMFVVFGFQVPHKAKDKQDCERGICFLCFDCIDYGPNL